MSFLPSLDYSSYCLFFPRIQSWSGLYLRRRGEPLSRDPRSESGAASGDSRLSLPEPRTVSGYGGGGVSDLRRRASLGPLGPAPAAGGATWPDLKAHRGTSLRRPLTPSPRAACHQWAAPCRLSSPRRPPTSPARGNQHHGGGWRQEQQESGAAQGGNHGCHFYNI